MTHPRLFDVSAFGNSTVLSWPSAALASTPVAWWRVGEPAGVFDDSIGPNDGNAVGGITRDVAGCIDNNDDGAVLLNGTTGLIAIPDNAILDLGNGPFTLGAWIRRGLGAAGDDTILSKGENAYNMRVAGNNRVQLIQSGIAVAIESAGTITDQARHFVVARYNGATGAVFIDGVDDTLSVATPVMANNANTLRIGADSSPADAAREFFEGVIDEVLIWSRMLTANEIRALFAAGTFG